jgi:D-erythronate 2-dehydrogenase
VLPSILKNRSHHQTLGSNRFAIRLAVNLQTALLTPPFWFALFHGKAAAPKSIRIRHIHAGIVPFVMLQLFGPVMVMAFAEFALWLPRVQLDESQKERHMRVLIIGAAGMIGRKLAASVLAQKTLGGIAVDALDLVDAVAPVCADAAGMAITRQQADLSDVTVARNLIARRPDIIVHLAAIVSGEAEQDLVKGYRINLDGTRNLLEAIRLEGDTAGYVPRLIFASSIAVFGAPFPERIDDAFLAAPLTSYGTQKAMGELMLSDYCRKGLLDGIALRLPTICIRPGRPNKAASGFFSNILREPLIGRPAVLPVSQDVRAWIASPRSAIGFIRHAADIDLARLGARRALNMPGLSVTVGDQIAALARVAGADAAGLIEPRTDPAIAAIVQGWPRDFDTARAAALGFRAETSMEKIIQIHIKDELGGAIQL